MRLGHPDNDGDQDDDDDGHDDDIIMIMNMLMVMVIQSTNMMVDLEKHVLSNDNIVTVLVRFQLILMIDIKYSACRDLSPYRPYQELISNNIFNVS